jgi:hypothetical protein
MVVTAVHRTAMAIEVNRRYLARKNCSGRRVACKSAADTAASTSFFRRERRYDFFEARIAAERVPDREQF